MPIVGKKEYSYSPEGMAMAKAEAKKTGKRLKKAVKLKPSSDDKMADAMDRGINKGLKNFRR